MRLHIRSSRRLALHAELYDQAGISLGPDQVAVHSGVAVAAKGDGATAKEHDWYVDAVFRRVQHYDIVLHALDCEAEGDDPAEVDYYTDHRFRQVLSFGKPARSCGFRCGCVFCIFVVGTNLRLPRKS